MIRDTGAPVYRLKVVLKGIQPPIWRRFLVPSDITLRRFHDCLQAVMGWNDIHLHQFEARGVCYGPTSHGLDEINISESKTRIHDVLRELKDRIIYVYDFGDNWVHEVFLEALLLPQKGRLYPVIEKGRRACPPENVGGRFGYGVLVEALENPEDPEHDDMLEWVGSEFDPDAFDIEAANLAVRRFLAR
jgi:hypothetical protein